MKFLLAILLILVPSALVAGGTDAELEEGIIKIEVTGISSRDFYVRFSGDTLYLPYSQLCDYLRVIQNNNEPMDTVRGELPAGRRFALTASGTLVDDTLSGTFPSSWYRVIDGEVYVRDSLLAGIMHIRFAFDFNQLKLEIAPDARIPLVSLKHDARRYKRLAASNQGEGVREEDESSIRRSMFGSLLLDWSLNGMYEESVSSLDLRYRGGSGNGSVGLSTPFLFGNLNVIGRGLFTPYKSEEKIAGIGSARWGVVLPGSSWLTRFSVSADLSGHNGETRLYHAELNNIPLGGRDHLGFHDLRGETNPGWTVEMYDGLQLLEVTQADSVGLYRFSIPVGYGTVKRLIHSVGPHAERVIEERMLQFNQSLLPEGEIEYSVRGTSESLDSDSVFHAGVNVRAGVLPWLSVGAESGMQLRPSSGTAGLADSINPVLVVDLWTGGVSAVGFRYNPKATAIWTSANWMPIDGLNLALGLDSLAFSDMTFAARAQGSYGTQWGYASLSGGYAKIAAGSMITASPQFFTSLYGVSVGVSSHLQWTMMSIANGGVTPASSSNSRMTTAFQVGSMVIPNCRVSLKGIYDHGAGSLSTMAAQADVRLFGTFAIGLSYSVPELDWKSGIAGVGLSMGLGGISTSVFGTHSDLGSGYTASSTVQGGVLVSSAGLDFTRTTSSGQPQLIVLAYRDENDNGRWDGEEPELESPLVTVRQRRTTTEGRDRLFLSPYQETLIEVDQGQFVSQGLYPSKTTYNIYTQPGGVQVIRVPFSLGVDVVGNCEVHTAAGSSRRLNTSAINGLRVVLQSTDGAAEYEGEIFSDGTLLVSGVRQGTYAIAVDADQLAQRRLAVKSLPEAITIDAKTQLVPTIVLIPAQR